METSGQGCVLGLETGTNWDQVNLALRQNWSKMKNCVALFGKEGLRSGGDWYVATSSPGEVLHQSITLRKVKTRLPRFARNDRIKCRRIFILPYLKTVTITPCSRRINEIAALCSQ